MQEHRTADGPWRVGGHFHLLVRSRVFGQDPFRAAAALASSLGAAEVPVSRVVLIGTEAADGLGPTEVSSGNVAIRSASDVASAVVAAVGAGADCLLIAASGALEVQTIEELRRVVDSDPMIAGVSPRFENAGRAVSAAPLLPEVTYVPLPDHRCLYLKGSVLAGFGRVASAGEVDWDDYALHINRYGFRMARANQALAHSPEPNMDLAERLTRLEPRYPGTRAAVAFFLSGAPRTAERLLAALAPAESGRREVAFDLTHLGPHHSGTAELARALIERAFVSWRDAWDVFVVARPEAYAFHFRDGPVRPLRIDPEDPRAFGAFIRIGQPFSWKELDHAVRRAPVLVFFMLDTIGLDCIRMAPDELDALWRFTLAEADGLLFNSAFTERQFERRFQVSPDLPRLASLHSLRLEDYGPAGSAAAAGESVLIVGNSFAHKYVEETARLLAAAYPGRAIVALGPKPGAIAGVASYPSGSLAPDIMAGLYRDARVVVYPSVYEGFGFPLLEALAQRRPVLVRALAPFPELLSGLPERDNVHLFHTDADLVRLVGADLSWVDRPPGPAARDWNDSTADLREILEEAVGRVSYHRVLRRVEFMRGRMEWIRGKRFRSFEATDDEARGEDVERLAGFAGRMAQAAVLKLGQLPGSRALLDLAQRALTRGRRP